MTETAVSVRGLGKKFRLYHERNQSLKSAIMRRKVSEHEDFWALRDITFDVPQGSNFALIGSNGSGKSTLLKCLAKILWPDEGEITSTGRVASLLEVGSGFHPELSGRENIFLNGSILGMSRKEVARKFDEIVDFSEIGKFIDQPVKSYSSGMYVRLGFSVAIHVQPDVLVVDEILAVGDAAFQEKSRAKFDELHEQGKTVILVSHSLGTVMQMCDQAAWIEKGSLRQVGPVEDVAGAYTSSVFPIAPEFEAAFDRERKSELGWPSSHRNPIAVHGHGVVQAFQRGALCWSERTGVHAIKEPIRTFFNAVGGIDELGWPKDDAVTTGDGTVRQHFLRGTIEIPQSGIPRLTPVE
ncbi:ATP-binding cassette domain-containing protein [Leucobacter sp. CSA1]|uniref:ATP-binding cassette domain-containing protein n=1 Tax=Leucobacter chromiisoli TaxID=2796471 RepID=A0A934Q5B5_9MICO|nr:ATP-binding cassette domain-containing protein [Leucobacter chromiisoli]MBK0417670.1 ATP-binding cassette domain-containing protein [Leucobacter chromiisoli]